MQNTWQRLLPQSALVLSAILLVLAYSPVLKAILDPGLQFYYGDFQTKVGPDSAQLREETALYTYTNGDDNLQSNNRFFILSIFSSVSDLIPFSDTQFHAFIMLFSMLLGCIGLYLLVLKFEKTPEYQAALIFFFVLFYFLNFWAVDRVAHVWIWFTYAMFPLFMFLGLEFVSGGDRAVLVGYSLALAFFGFLPHSFLYLLIIHGVMVANSLLQRKGLKEVALLAIVPVIIYVGVNLPAVAMFPYLSQIYPFEVDKQSPHMLSRNGELENVLSLSNPWWPQIPYERFSENPVYQYSGMLIFALSAFIIFRAYGTLKERALLLLCVFAILVFIFMAMGTKNPIMEIIIFWGIDSGLGRILGLFREWGRISIMIPLFLCMALALSLSVLRNREKRILVALLAVLVFLNISFSPAWDYMELLRAKHLPPYYSELMAPSGNSAKALLFVNYVSDQNFPVQTYTDYPVIGRFLDRGPLNSRILDSLNIYRVFWDRNSSKRNLSWMDCDEGNMTICDNPGAKGMFSVYSGAVGAANQTKYLDAVLLGTNSGFAVSNPNGTEFTAYDLNGSPNRNGKAVYIIEAERDFGKVVKPLVIEENPDASSGKQVRFRQRETISREISVADPGNYTIALRGNGGFLIKLGEHFRKVWNNGSGFAYFGPLNVSDGGNEFSISGDNGSTIDVVWLYQSDMTLDKAFPAPKARVVSEERIDPTLWRADIEAGSPFILSFAEPYNRLFEAMVTDESGKNTKIKPAEILGGINGFAINDTGRLEVEVRFTPQEAYAPAFISTWITLLCCCAYLAFAWWKR